jgi:hypothetical protein
MFSRSFKEGETDGASAKDPTAVKGIVAKRGAGDEGAARSTWQNV